MSNEPPSRDSEALRESEARKAAILDAALDCVIIMDHEGLIRHWNSAAERTFGYRRDEVLGTELAAKIIPPSLRERHRRGLAHYLSTGEGPVLGRRIEVSAMRADGSEFPCELAISPIHIGERPLFTAYLRDISERQGMEAAVSASERRWRLLFEQAPFSVQTFSPDGRTRQMNAAGEKLWGVTAQSLVDWNLLEMDESLAPMDEIRRAFTGAVVTIPPYRYRTKQVPGISTTGVADDKWIGCVFYPVFDEAGRLEEVVCIHEDATARWQAEEKIRRMNAELERRILERTTELAEANVRLHRALEREQELGRLKSNFVSLVSHEFRTPLGIILSSSEILQQYLSTLEEQERQEQLEAIKTNVLRMSSLMEEVLFFSGLEAGKFACQPAPLDLEDFLRRLCDEMRSATHDRCPFIWRAGNDLSGAKADETLLHRLFSNVLINAAKYSPERSPVHFSARREGVDAVFEVTDHGIGIPAEAQPRLFEAFFRAENVAGRAGTGLGLIIVRRCVELHRGTISIESTEGLGTCVRVRLPLYVPMAT
jgi:PAS domain S-box-containing protein